MVDEQKEFDLLMQRARSGCAQAAREVFDIYSPHIRRVVRRQLHHRLRAQFDSLDFTQDVWKSFFTIPPERYTFTCPEALIGFLSTLAYNKVVAAYRLRMQSRKYNVNREHSLEVLADETAYHPPARQPSPSQLAIANERWEQLVSGQPPRFRQALELLRQGHSFRDIADHLGLHPKMVQRLLRRLYGRVEP